MKETLGRAIETVKVLDALLQREQDILNSITPEYSAKVGIEKSKGNLQSHRSEITRLREEKSFNFSINIDDVTLQNLREHFDALIAATKRAKNFKTGGLSFSFPLKK